MQKELESKYEVLRDLEGPVRDLIAHHESKRELWFPSEFLPADQGTQNEKELAELRKRAEGVSDNARVALTLNILTEEGLPHFHRLIAHNLGNGAQWKEWNGLWTAEEDRHGNILRDYIRDSRLLNFSALEKLQFDYIRSGFHPGWSGDPYKIFVYTSCQEKATSMSHLNTGKLVAEQEPLLFAISQKIAQDESRHYAFYLNVFREIIARDPNVALECAAGVMPSIDMPGISMANFNEYADVVRRSGIYGPRDYQKIVEQLIGSWNIGVLTQLNEIGRKAQEKIMSIPARLQKVADFIESRVSAKNFTFDVIFGRVLEMA
ncbi:MAG: acyl-ACP desaturase [Bacteroidetes bacterium]|nr:acyl-ACP desaturase [Bacteroidota bacterium]MCL5738157.1 acyl-ACP desaturase [Bacteroidota bacterium]